VWHYPWLLAMHGTSREALLMMLMFTAATTYASLFLGWLQQRTGSIWGATVGHSANNTLEDPLTRTLFSPAAATLGPAASAAVLAAEAAVLAGVALLGRDRGEGHRPRRQCAPAARWEMLHR
jgi:membrane protease YdiL (CAAX protease family)